MQSQSDSGKVDDVLNAMATTLAPASLALHTVVTIDDVLSALKTMPGRTVELTPAQEAAIKHGSGPLWIIAGPGSGKTETLVLRCLKLVLVDHVDPRSVIVTTFTEKAGRSLQDRLITYKTFLESKFAAFKDVDLTQLRVGTLHSLCNDILLEYRFPGYRNFRPMEDMEQLLLIYFHCGLGGSTDKLTGAQVRLLRHFRYLFDGRSRRFFQGTNIPGRWARSRVAQILFNRIVEDQANLKKMKAKGGYWKTLAKEFEQYEATLNSTFRVDFAHMQSKLLDFLKTPGGQGFLLGTTKPNGVPITHILVDEYQDTNPIQAEIYFSLANNLPHNLTVVGDDDQALYRFRGGTVESIINFDKVCIKKWGISPARANLIENHRSHEGIVRWCNEYIKSFNVMKTPGARAPGKPDLVAKSKITGNWPAVTVIMADRKRDLADEFAKAVKHFKRKGMISDYSECAFLIHSTKETLPWARAYAEGLRAKGIQIYNPRSKKFLEHDEVRLVLGALLSIIDSKRTYPMVPAFLQSTCDDWRKFYRSESKKYRGLRVYVSRSAKAISNLKAKVYLPSTLQEVFYHILNKKPFKKWLQDPEVSIWLGQLTSIVEAYASTPVPNHSGLSRGSLGSNATPGQLNSWWLHQLYNALFSLLERSGIDDPEAEDTLYPKGKVPFMTVHQAKGLEFPIVFVAGIDEEASVDGPHRIEEEFQQFRQSMIKFPPAIQRAKEDLIRFYFVAYSRAQYALFLLHHSRRLNPGDGKGKTLGLGGTSEAWLRSLVAVEEL